MLDLDLLLEVDEVDMLTVVLVGSSNSRLAQLGEVATQSFYLHEHPLCEERTESW